ncbi:carboxypeptidase regulatory-like domain-containing protein [bacterium]|nr:carboxypeptidase regulatory-like domain-containing protein [bacterium]
MGIQTRAITVALCIALMSALLACGGNGGSNQNLQLINQDSAAGLSLPELSDLDTHRDASVATQIGISPQQFMSTGGVIGTPGENLLLDSSAEAASWALYSYHTGTDPLISLRLTFTYPNGPGAFVALANYQTGRWDWQPKAQLTQVTTQLSTNANRNYVSPQGNMFFVVASFDDRDVQITDLLVVADVPPPPSFSISGRVADADGIGISGVNVALTPGTASTSTDGNGNYSFAGVEAGSYVLTPSKTDFTFDPATLKADVVASDLTGKNFTGTTTALPVTYIADIEALIDGAGGTEKSCLDCHSGQFPDADLDLSTYTAVKDNATKINQLINETNSDDWMPKNNDKWSQAHLDLFQQWIDDGLLEQ